MSSCYCERRKEGIHGAGCLVGLAYLNHTSNMARENRNLKRLTIHNFNWHIEAVVMITEDEIVLNPNTLTELRINCKLAASGYHELEG